ncbi:AAA family ATPase [Laedolimicola ammoniilytica]|uniref:Cytidylate kinase-like family protein n=1 Tax=Laedolimicola ammoniilytica TaxID=2981771 RepID=A0ABT2RT43_9FIRM|nr:cytidylate kinase-like family protein [Laedolimicola ammoniilytica]MCU6695491.1 cytidylate kinase-like family protein [Laedolimicola ammoniilytica]SCH00412.1 cytidylate kinase [uncultured Clostridium sp.]
MDKFIIAITRTCGSGATSIGKILAKNLGVEIYDRNILRLASDDSGISEELFARADEDQKQSLLFRASQKVYSGGLIPPEKEDFTSNNNLFNYQAKVLRELADESNYVVIGRAADYVLRDKPGLVRVYIYASREKCIEKEMNRQKIDWKTADKFISKTDKYRRDYYRYFTGQEWENMQNYDLCINTTQMTYERAAKAIQDFAENMLAGK